MSAAGREQRRPGEIRAALLAGAAGALAARALLGRLLLIRFRRGVRALNAGDSAPILSSYAEHAVLYFAEGQHRWAGAHRGKPAIAAFLQSFIDAGLEGEIVEVAFSGAPWRITMLARFDDHALDPQGEVIYRNRTVLMVRTRWGKIVRQDDFYEDTASIDELEVHLRAREE